VLEIMSKGLIGKKVGMTSLFMPDGNYIPVTVLEVGPCTVTQIKTVATDGYNALQLGFGSKRPSRVNRPVMGHMKKAGDKLFSELREFAVDNPENFNVGQELGIGMFDVGEAVMVTGTSKGRGFQGVVKRHGFRGGKDSHGCKSHRVPGSIGTSAWPSRVTKGKKMPGQYGVDRHTIKNLKIVDIRPEQNLLLIKGAIPGPSSGMVLIKKLKER
jgi:large subunit ribosomal protein L3